MKKRDQILLSLLLVLVLPGMFFLGCAREEAVEVELEPMFEGVVEIDRSAWEIGRAGGRIVIADFGDPKSLNPIISEETSTSDITNVVFDSAVERDQHTLEWTPGIGLDESWEVSDDNLSLTVKLKKGLKWSDGEPLTAEDIVFTMNDLIFAKDAEGNFIVECSEADGVMVGDEYPTYELIDELTYKVTVPQVTARLKEVSSVQPVPKHIVEPLIKEKGVAAFNSFWGLDADVTTIVCSGPFTVAEYVPNQKVVFKKNPNYYGKDAKGRKLPYLDEIVRLIVEDTDTMMAKFMAGETDVYAVRGEDYAILVDKKEELDIEIYNVGPAGGTQFITMNQNPIEGEEDGGIEPPVLTWLSNLKFRLAMAHLVDRQTIVDNIAYGFGYPQYSPIWTKSPYYWEGSEDAAFKFDPKRAKQLLDEIGYLDTDGDGWREDDQGNKIELILNTNSGNRAREAIGKIFTEEVRKAGIDLTFKPEDFNALVTRIVSSYDWQLILIGLTGGPDPGGGSNVYPSNGNLHMIEPNQESPRRDWEKAVDAAWDEANLTVDEAQRKRGFEKVQRLWIENVPWVYTFNVAQMTAYKTKLRNGKPHPLNDYATINCYQYLYWAK